MISEELTIHAVLLELPEKGCWKLTGHMQTAAAWAKLERGLGTTFL